MSETMFCYQCEQTKGCKGCTGSAGVCQKSARTAILQDQLTGALIGLARAASSGSTPTESTHRAMIHGLFATLTNVNFSDESIEELTETVREEHRKLSPNCASCASPCSRGDEYDLNLLWQEPDEDVRSLKSLLLFGLRGMAAYAWHALALGKSDDTVNQFFYRGMFYVGYEAEAGDLLPLVLELGSVNLRCMELLDAANTGAFGDPSPTVVSFTVEKGPFIVISGHDLHDLKLLLEQTKGTGVNVYTHGEMLPAHAYPALAAYPHLKGNFGTAWQNQNREFDNIPAPVLFTTNCLMPPKDSYADRVFTTGPVAFPGMKHIGEDKDFSPVIQKALELCGYSEPRSFTGANGGPGTVTGYGHHAILEAAGQVVEAVRSGAIRHFFLVGGCDGARPGRSYYTDFVKQAPKDSVILTLGCGKYRFNDLDLGAIGCLPRLMDMGQCNDAFGAIKVAQALADVFGCGVNDLPLTLVLSWYEQKAVCILLSLLHLGIKNIYIGPTLPAFISPGVLKILAGEYALTPVSTPGEDLKKILADS